ncbi:MAG: short-chain dehydrogenase, partial [Gammaproteobacteria bacterium]
MNVVVIGANRGIGLGFVRHYLETGHHVWASYRSSAGGLDSLRSDHLKLFQWDVC